MTTTILLAAVLFGPICTECWQIDRPAIEIVQSLAAKVPSGPAAHFPPEAVRLLEIIHVYAAVEAWPAEHYYRVTVRMLQPPDVPIARRLRRVEKTLEIWATGNTTKIRSTLDIAWGREGWLSERVLRNRVWPLVRDWERRKIEALSDTTKGNP
jgi:hypothetical protein